MVTFVAQHLLAQLMTVRFVRVVEVMAVAPAGQSLSFHFKVTV